VRDGDTVELDDLPIRLQGLAAPERCKVMQRRFREPRDTTLARAYLLSR
jgi:endonuclease YncB( thermonuclease family)